MAQCAATGDHVAIKFFLCLLDLKDHVRRLDSISDDLARGLRLPKRYCVIDNQSGRYRTDYGATLPPCVIVERGESLHVWLQRTQPNRFRAFQVCMPALQCVAFG